MRRKKRLNDWHHRRCSSNGGKNNDRNLVRVDKGKHQSWHHLFRNHHPEVICDIINLIWLDPDYLLICILKENNQHKGQRGALIPSIYGRVLEPQSVQLRHFQIIIDKSEFIELRREVENYFQKRGVQFSKSHTSRLSSQLFIPVYEATTGNSEQAS